MAEQIRLEVTGDLEGLRVDRAVASLLELSRAKASVVVDAGVLLDDLPVKASDRVRAGQILTMPTPREVPGLRPEPIDFEVLHEDTETVVVDKPAGLVVHPGSGRATGTLASGLIYRFPDLVGVGMPDRWGLVHRLDRDTSGAILVARTADAYRRLTAQLRERRIVRIYTTLVEGTIGAPTGTIDAPIGRDPRQPTRRAVVHTGKPARTHFEVLDHYATGDASLLEVRLETGRTHQIRVHMAAIGHAVAGDAAYGASRKDLGAPRTFLHASRLEFRHPATEVEMKITSMLPSDLVSVLAALDSHETA